MPNLDPPWFGIISSLVLTIPSTGASQADLPPRPPSLRTRDLNMRQTILLLGLASSVVSDSHLPSRLHSRGGLRLSAGVLAGADRTSVASSSSSAAPASAVASGASSPGTSSSAGYSSSSVDSSSSGTPISLRPAVAAYLALPTTAIGLATSLVSLPLFTSKSVTSSPVAATQTPNGSCAPSYSAPTMVTGTGTLPRPTSFVSRGSSQDITLDGSPYQIVGPNICE